MSDRASLNQGRGATRRVLSPRPGSTSVFPASRDSVDGRSAPGSPRSDAGARLSPRLNGGKQSRHQRVASSGTRERGPRSMGSAAVSHQPVLTVFCLVAVTLGLIYSVTIWLVPSVHVQAVVDFTAVDGQSGYINIRPITREAKTRDKHGDTRYLAYYPHSGYHNQRIALENALTLAKLLKRTLLLPPCRFGNAVPYIKFDKLNFRVNQGVKTGLEKCADFGEFGVLPRECIGYFDWTLVSWDLLVDTKHIEQTLQQPIIDRWNATDAWLQDTLGIGPNDTYALKDQNMYQYRIYDSRQDTEPLEKFENRLELDELRKLDNHKLLHVGSLFGTSRLRTVEEDNWEIRSSFRQAMVFRNPELDRITDTIRDRLGGPASYYSVHMRIGDGIFQQNAQANAITVMTQMLSKKMLFDQAQIDEILSEHLPDYKLVIQTNHRQKRDLITEGDPTDIPVESEDTRSTIQESIQNTTHNETPNENGEKRKFVKRASNSRPQRPGAYRHPWPAPIPDITSRRNSPLHRSLTCRGPLYQGSSPTLRKLNAPLFLATDSRIPTADPVLALFFKVFPCTFVLADFARVSAYNVLAVPGLKELEEWKNEEDHVQLAQFLYPVVDMMIAAKARGIIGTPQSTFSRFAVDVLFQSYHDWPIVERG